MTAPPLLQRADKPCRRWISNIYAVGNANVRKRAGLVVLVFDELGEECSHRRPCLPDFVILTVTLSVSLIGLSVKQKTTIPRPLLLKAPLLSTV